MGSTTTVSSGINTQFQPAVNQLVQGAQAAAAKPYEAYGGQRVAGLSGLQNQALTGIAGLQAFQPTQYTQQSWTDPGMQQQFMSPYQQGVTDIAKREAQRTADIEATKIGAGAVNQGAFGGYRHGIVEAEQARNAAQQQNDIQARGLQNAYASGMGQFNTQNQLGLQTQQAQELANRYGYQTGIGNLQEQLRAGALPRDIQQQQYDVGYQDYLRQQEYPYKQMDFLRSSLSGLPLSSTSTNFSYDKPGGLQQGLGMIGAGTALYNQGMFKGLGSLFGGGGTNPDNMRPQFGNDWTYNDNGTYSLPSGEVYSGVV